MVTKLGDFGDQPQIERIKERLWGERELGRAAVMVGSGFSRNAEARSPSVGSFPLWSEVATAMLNTLYPKETTPEDERQWRESHYDSVAGAIQLASEYAALFGRESLDDLVLNLVPDDRYLPGHLHRLLLSLPWADVFTTNYDTLLETAALRNYDRKYGVVASPEDIPARERPRIVKLHGSFPHQRPFIITHEDFRTYPRRFAPFVNLVQQSAQENVLVLVGFSGEDPNFLSWTGWARDNLGDNAPVVYLCGLFNLSAAERRLLERRKVEPIDLSPMFPVDVWPDRDERYQRAIEWFLLNLMRGKPRDPDYWLGRHVEGDQWQPSSGLPELPPPQSFTMVSSDPPYSGSDSIAQVREVGKSWCKQREEYPGWIVAPHEKRERLAAETEYWFDAVLEAADNNEPSEALSLLYEFNWRLERALVPLFANQVETIVAVLERINPYPSAIDLPQANVTPKQSGSRNLEWSTISERWVELAFAVARTAREDQNETTFRCWMDRLEKVVPRRAEWRARWFHEECQYCLFRGDQDGIREQLAVWPEALGSPAWVLKRAALLAELGEVREANRLAEVSLEKIREQLQPGSRDLALLSLEGWAIHLLRVVRPNLPTETYRKEDFRERLRQLAPLGCNPSPEMYEAALILAGPTPEERVDVKTEVVSGFDPGTGTATTHFGAGLTVLPFFPAFGFARMLEEGALPPSSGNVVLEQEAVLNAARWIEPYAPMWSLSLLLRAAKTGESKELEDRFGRARVAMLATKEIERLHDTFVVAWSQAIRYLSDHTHELSGNVTGFAERQVRVLSYVLSRLTIRLDEGRRARMMDLALEMYALPVFRRFLKLHECVTLMFRRLLSQAMDPSEVLNVMDRLLSLPIPGEGGFTVAEPSKWPEPLDYVVDRLPNGGLPEGFDRSSWNSHVERLIMVVRSGPGEARARAVRRLHMLFDIGALIDKEIAAFGTALWSKTDPSSGLALLQNYPAYMLLSLPHPPGIDVEGEVRKHLLGQDFPRVVVGDGAVIPRGEDTLAQELRGPRLLIVMTEEDRQVRRVNWSPEEAKDILRKMSALWDQEKEPLRSHFGSNFALPGHDLANRFIDWVRLLAEVIFPKLAETDDADKELASKLILKMDETGICTSYAAPALLCLDESHLEWSTGKLWRGIQSEDSNEVGEAIRGIVLWLTLRSRDDRIPPLPEHLLDEMVNRAVGRRIPGLELTLMHLANLVRLHPGQLSKRHLDGACVALRYLLEDTRWPSEHERREPSAPRSTIPMDDRPEYRRRCTALAACLAVRYADIGEPAPEILSQWREESGNDTLPEIRRAWRN